MIKSVKDKRQSKIEIDLTGPDGNVFNLISIAMNLGQQMNKVSGEEVCNTKTIVDDMMSGNYEHAIDVLEKHFGNHIILYR